MNNSPSIENKIKSVLNHGEILLIIPPFGSIHDIAFGPHILQSLAQSYGYKTDILYLNILLASVIGTETYDCIYYSPEKQVLSERIFARIAYGLPSLGFNKNYSDLPQNGNGFETSSSPIPMEKLLEIETICKSFINEVISIITSSRYKIIGSTCSMLRQTNCSIALLSGIKKQKPEVITILGGSNCKGEMADGIASLNKGIDYIFQGESETSFLHFLKNYSENKLPQKRIIPGEPYNLNEIPFVDYDIFFKQYRHFLGETGTAKASIWYETSRGCWYAEKSKCNFCSEYHVTYRQKSSETVLRDLERFSESFPGQIILMTDLVMPGSYLKEVFPIIAEKKSKENFPFLGYQVRVPLSLEELVLMKKAKVKAVLPGIETFSTSLLKLMNKGITGSESLLFLRDAACAGIYVDWILLWGFPGDRVSDYEEVLKLLPLIRHLQPPRTLSPMTLMQFSPYFRNPEANQISHIHPWDVLRSIYPPYADIEKLAVYFSGEFPCDSHRHPEIIKKLSHEVDIWKNTWKQSSLFMREFMGIYAIYDSRGIHEKEKTHIIDASQAKEILSVTEITNPDELSDNLKWALEEKLGVIMDSRYIPLITYSIE